MPLIFGKQAKTKEGFQDNFLIELHAGKPKRQALAIAYSQARRAKQMKEGGRVTREKLLWQ